MGPHLSLWVSIGLQWQTWASFLCTSLVAVWTILHPLRPISAQITPVLSPGLFSEAWDLVPSPWQAPENMSWAEELWSSISVPAALSTAEGFLRARESFLFHSSLPWVQVPSRFLPCPFLVLPGYMVIFLAILILWDLLPAFSRYSMRIVSQVDISLVYLWEVSFMSFSSVILLQPQDLLFKIIFASRYSTYTLTWWLFPLGIKILGVIFYM